MMDIVVFGTDVAVYGVRQVDSIGSLEGNGQLVRHLAVLIPSVNVVDSNVRVTSVYNIATELTVRP